MLILQHEKDLAAGETKVEEAVNNKKVADGDDEDHAESAEKIVQEALAKGKENEEKKKKEEKKVLGYLLSDHKMLFMYCPFVRS